MLNEPDYIYHFARAQSMGEYITYVTDFLISYGHGIWDAL